MRTRLLRLATLIAAAASFVGIFPVDQQSAEAAFPGTNGRIFFQDAADHQIWSMNPNGSDREAVTSISGFATPPAVSPDGTRIVYALVTGQNPKLRVVSASGPDDDGVANTEGAEQPTWSPDNLHIAFVSGSDDIATVGSGLETLTHTPGVEEHSPDWSPDGTTIAFTRETDGAEDLWVMDADGENPRNVTNTPDRDETGPDWSPNGALIVLNYSDDNGVTSNIGAVNVATGALTPLTSGGADFDPAYSPDGQQIVFRRYLTATSNAAVPQGGAPTAIFVADSDGSNETNISGTNDPFDFYPEWGVDVPGSPPRTWGDNDCSDAHDAMDALASLLDEAEVGSPSTSCPALGQTLDLVGFGMLAWGDLNCSDGFDPPDVLLLLADAAGLPPASLQDCPALGTEIALTPANPP